jgi:hypothetical protein
MPDGQGRPPHGELGKQQMAFDYKVIAGPAMDPTLIKDADYALSQWSDLLDGKGTLNVALNWNDSLPSGRADTDVTEVPQTIEDGRIVTTASAAYALTSGQHAVNLPDGSGADVVINLDPSYVQKYLYLDPDPSASSAVPSDKVDAVSVFAHEIGHALGMNGYYPLNAGGTPDLGPFESSYDRLVAFQDGAPVFTGPNAEAANNGQPVPLTHFAMSDPQSSQNVYHLGATAGGAFGDDLMTGMPYHEGVRYSISATDLGIVQDVSGLTPAQEIPAPAPPAMGANVAADACDVSGCHHGPHHRMAFMQGGGESGAGGLGHARGQHAAMSASDFERDHHAERAGSSAGAWDQQAAAWAGAVHVPGGDSHWSAVPHGSHSASFSAAG